MKNSLRNKIIKSISLTKKIKTTEYIYDCIIPCYRFGKILKITLNHNIKYIDNITVVTGADDNETIKLCKYNNINHIICHEVFDKNGIFSESNFRNTGFASSNSDWIMSIDADIMVNDRFEFIKNLDPDFMYGCDRIIEGKKGNIIKPLGFLQIFNRHTLIKSGAKFAKNKRYGTGGPDTHFRKYWNGKTKMLPMLVNHYGNKGLSKGSNYRKCLSDF